jgi:hypothetical protein
MPTTTDATETSLFWGADGRVECAEHVPYPGSDTWRAGRYRRMSRMAIARFRFTNPQVFKHDANVPTCEVCRGIARRNAQTGVAR